MTYEVKISDEALFDISEAAFWDASKQPDLENKFLNEIKSCIEYLSKEPYTLQKRYFNVRIVFTKIFSFGIHFVIIDETVKSLLYVIQEKIRKIGQKGLNSMS